jgi:hypothetical protein
MLEYLPVLWKDDSSTLFLFDRTALLGRQFRLAINCTHSLRGIVVFPGRAVLEFAMTLTGKDCRNDSLATERGRILVRCSADAKAFTSADLRLAPGRALGRVRKAIGLPSNEMYAGRRGYVPTGE